MALLLGRRKRPGDWTCRFLPGIMRRTALMTFNPRKAHLQGADMFHRFSVRAEGEPLVRSDLPKDSFLLVFERGGQRRALDATQMTYHHVAQGDLSGEPYVVTF